MVLLTDNVLLREQAYECRSGQAEQTTTASKAVYIQATVDRLDYPLIPFFVLKEDPIAAAEHYLNEKYGLEKEYERTDELNEEQLYDAWNSVFTGLEPEQQFFLYAWASVPGVSSAILRTMGLVFVIATPGPLNTRWLTTRPVWHEGALVAWCVPVDMHQRGQERIERILLAEENMLRFTSPALWLPNISRLEKTWVNTEDDWLQQCPANDALV